MAKNKLKRFAAIADMPHVLEITEFEEENKAFPRGRWHKDYFKNENPITLELACGKGEYSVYFGRNNQDMNLIGIDIKGSRMFMGAQIAVDEGLDNVFFLRTYIDHLEKYFAQDEVSDIWIIFPDPYLKNRKSQKRLTSPKFLRLYEKVLKKDGTINLKTDSPTLWHYTLEVIKACNCEVIEKVEDVYRERANDPVLTNRTFYEEMHLENKRTIRYIKFKLPDELRKDIDTITLEEDYIY